MAGFYPDVPAPRMAYDIDGTVGFRLSAVRSGTVTALSNANLITWNDETTSTITVGPASSSNSFGLIFPQLRDIVGFLYWTGVGNSTFDVSSDTTNGVDGTWSSPATLTNLATAGGAPQTLRTNILTVSWTGVKAVRETHAHGGSPTSSIWHIYGTISSGETPDRLRMWHPTLDEPLDDNTTADGAHLDWAEVTQGTTADKTFRIKNESATLTANSIDITTEVLTDASPAIGPQITYSDGGAFATTLNIGNLSPGTLSSVITVRRTTSSSAALSVWWWRTVAEAGSWT